MNSVVFRSLPYDPGRDFAPVSLLVGAPKALSCPAPPTLAESGVPFVFDSGFIALFAPAGTPRDAIAALHREVVNAAQQGDLRDWLVGQGYEVVASTPEYLAERVSTQIDFWRRFVRERNLKFDN